MKHILLKVGATLVFMFMVSSVGYSAAYGYGITTSTQVGVRAQNIAAFKAVNTNRVVPYKLAQADTSKQRAGVVAGLAPVAINIQNTYSTLEASSLAIEEKQGLYAELSKVMQHFISLFVI